MKSRTRYQSTLWNSPRLVLLSLLLLIFQAGMAGSQLEKGDLPPPDLGRDLNGNRISLEDFRDRRRNRVSRAYEIKHLPRLMILDRQGRVAHLHTRYDKSFLDQIIEQLNKLLAIQD